VQLANVRLWHLADMRTALENVRFGGDCVAKLSDGARWFAFEECQSMMLCLALPLSRETGGRYSVFDAL